MLFREEKKKDALSLSLKLKFMQNLWRVSFFGEEMNIFSFH